MPIVYINRALYRDSKPSTAKQTPTIKCSTSINRQNAPREMVPEKSQYRSIILSFIVSITNCRIIKHPFSQTTGQLYYAPAFKTACFIDCT